MSKSTASTAFALLNAEIDTVTQGRIDRGAVVVRSGKIVAVGKNPRIPASAERIDCTGRLVTPGLIEAHSHAGLSEDGYPNDADVNEMTDPVTPHIQAIDGFKPTDIATREAAFAGVTGMFICQGSANVFCGIGAVVKTWGPNWASQIVNPAAGMKMAMGENPKRVYGSRNQRPGTRMAVAAIMRETLAAADNYRKKKRVHARKPAGKGKTKDPFETDLKLEAVARLLGREFPARCHCHRAIDMLTFMRVAKEYNLRFCFEHATEAHDILPELLAAKAPLVIGPTFGSRSKREVQYKSFRTVAQAVEAGLTVAITSDHWVTPMQSLPVYVALAVREGLPAERALETVTINPARILGADDRLGSIENGKDADLVVWDGDWLDVRNKPWRVFINGQAVPPPPAVDA